MDSRAEAEFAAGEVAIVESAPSPKGSQVRRVVLYSASGRQLAVQSGADFSLPPG